MTDTVLIYDSYRTDTAGLIYFWYMTHIGLMLMMWPQAVTPGVTHFGVYHRGIWRRQDWPCKFLVREVYITFHFQIGAFTPITTQKGIISVWGPAEWVGDELNWLEGSSLDKNWKRNDFWFEQQQLSYMLKTVFGDELNGLGTSWMG